MRKRERPAVGRAGLTRGGLGYRQQTGSFVASEMLKSSPAASSSGTNTHNALADFLLKECMWGFMPAWKAQVTAELGMIVFIVYVCACGQPNFLCV